MVVHNLVIEIKKEENIVMGVTVHCLVKNEDRWAWFAIQSVLPFIERMIIYDTGSTDKTVSVIKSIPDEKIQLKKVGEVSKKELVKLRQDMIKKTETEWFLILDGDEIWPEESIKNTIKVAENAPANIVAIFNPVRNCIGDVFHFLPESAGHYKIGDKSGNLNIRLIKKSPTMEVVGEYPLEVYQDKNGPIQNQKDNLLFADNWYLHTSFLQRSSKDTQKVSGSFGKNKIWQKGVLMDKKNLPEVLLLDYPSIVDNPLESRGFIYELGSLILEPLVFLKRKIT